MNGKRLLLDTNAIVALLRNHPEIINYTKSTEWMGISVISQIEFLSFSALTIEDRQLFDEFVARVHVIGIRADDNTLVELIAKIRRTTRVKLPDAVVAATALQHDATIVTADKRLSEVPTLHILSFSP